MLTRGQSWKLRALYAALAYSAPLDRASLEETTTWRSGIRLGRLTHDELAAQQAVAETEGKRDDVETRQ